MGEWIRNGIGLVMVLAAVLCCDFAFRSGAQWFVEVSRGAEDAAQAVRWFALGLIVIGLSLAFWAGRISGRG